MAKRALAAASCLLLSMTAAPDQSSAQPAGEPSEEDLAAARTDLEVGDRYFELGRYPEAIAAYERGFARTRKAGFLYNIAQSHRLAGDCREAVDKYNEYLAADPESTRRSNVEEFLAELGDCSPAPVNTNTANPTNNLSAGGAASDTDADGTGSTGASFAADSSVTNAVDDGGSSSPALLRYSGLGLMATSVALIATSGYFIKESSDKKKELKNTCSTDVGGACSLDTYNDLVDEGDALNTWAWVTGIAGGAALAGGITLYVLGLRSDDGSEGLALTPTGDGATMAWTGSF